jgi:sortase (surface protein transpeptidase)
VTCFPFDYVGDAPQRLIVRAHRVESPDEPSRTVVAAGAAAPAAAVRN